MELSQPEDQPTRSTGGAHPANPSFLCSGELSGRRGSDAGGSGGRGGTDPGRKSRTGGSGPKAASGRREERREEEAEPRSTAPEEGEEAGCFLVHSRPAPVTHWG